jgi:hypothetical protein
LTLGRMGSVIDTLTERKPTKLAASLSAAA